MTPSNYASHSFKIGAATTAAAAGLPPAVIKTLGHWKSNAYETYIQYPPSELQGYLLAQMQAPSLLGILITLVNFMIDDHTG